MLSLVVLFALCAVAFGAEEAVEAVEAVDEVEQAGPSVIGMFGGIVHQPNPNVLYNLTLSMTPTGTGYASFFNPALGFKCMGAVKWHSQQTYLYNLVVDHSTSQGACLVWGNLVMQPGPGYAQVSLFPQGAAQPAFTSSLTQWV
eukprot:TRINITY_DN174_c0_g1_i1.p2 TRINITY_DN174_c0_g1~~TRINITY_DN174_c0_g1_i1.p2  ORF type:complete len:144 (+),score=39.77 TRINITY_DN174_c0_g1_i1:130-561(+)